MVPRLRHLALREVDVGKVDERGYVVIVGRSKDLIISGGYNVYPAEIEGVLGQAKAQAAKQGGNGGEACETLVHGCALHP